MTARNPRIELGGAITGKPVTRKETLPLDFDLALYSAELLDPDSWGEILRRFAYTMRMAVALTDVHGRLLGPCYNPQPVWSLARKAMVESGGTESSAACPFCLAPQTACSGVSDALIRGKITYLSDSAGLSHAAIPLFLGNRPVGGLIAGQTFTRYPQPLALQRIARRFGASQQDLWNAAVHQMPVSRVTLGLYGDLLETLGHAFVRQRYAGILDRQLNVTNQRYRLMIEGANDRALFTIDGSGTVISWNSGAEQLLGYAKSEILGRNYSDFFVTEDIRSGIPRRGIRLAEQTGWTEQEYWQVRKDGTRFLSEIVIARLGEGETVEYGTLLHDVTEQRKATEAAVQAQKLESIGVLAGGIAHDFNNLLTGILGSLSLAMEGLPPDDAARPLLSIAEQASLRAAELIAQLLAYAGRGTSVVAPVDLSDLITKILPLIDTSIPKTVQLELNLAPDLPWINADSSEIQQVIMNLVINGAEAFGPEGGILRVSAGVADSESNSQGQPSVYFEVQDTGCGMDEATKARIFEPFFTTKFAGRGLGLSAVEGIIRRAKGRLEVESTPGVGSTFRAVFPGEPAQSTAPEAVSKVHTGGTGLILVVDDEALVRVLARAVLEQDGYSIMTARNGREGVDMFRHNAEKIKAVLLDLTMPVMGGAEALRLMKEIRPEIPVILSTGYAENDVREQFTGERMLNFISKPYTASTLRVRIAEALAPAPKAITSSAGAAG